MLRHSLSRAGSVWRAVAVVISWTMVCKNSFLFSALVRTFRKVRRSDRHMAQTRVPNKGSTGSALQGRQACLSMLCSLSGSRQGNLQHMYDILGQMEHMVFVWTKSGAEGLMHQHALKSCGQSACKACLTMSRGAVALARTENSRPESLQVMFPYPKTPLM